MHAYIDMNDLELLYQKYTTRYRLHDIQITAKVFMEVAIDC